MHLGHRELPVEQAGQPGAEPSLELRGVFGRRRHCEPVRQRGQGGADRGCGPGTKRRQRLSLGMPSQDIAVQGGCVFPPCAASTAVLLLCGGVLAPPLRLCCVLLCWRTVSKEGGEDNVSARHDRAGVGTGRVLQPPTASQRACCTRLCAQVSCAGCEGCGGRSLPGPSASGRG